MTLIPNRLFAFAIDPSMARLITTAFVAGCAVVPLRRCCLQRGNVGSEFPHDLSGDRIFFVSSHGGDPRISKTINSSCVWVFLMCLPPPKTLATWPWWKLALGRVKANPRGLELQCKRGKGDWEQKIFYIYYIYMVTYTYISPLFVISREIQKILTCLLETKYTRINKNPRWILNPFGRSLTNQLSCHPDVLDRSWKCCTHRSKWPSFSPVKDVLLLRWKQVLRALKLWCNKTVTHSASLQVDFDFEFVTNLRVFFKQLGRSIKIPRV